MRFRALIGIVLGFSSAAPSAEAAVITYNLSGTGNGVHSLVYTEYVTVGFNGVMSFDTDKATDVGGALSYSESFTDPLGRNFVQSAELTDNSLYLSMRIFGLYPGNIREDSTFSARINFVDGYLDDMFPTAFDPTKIMSTFWAADTLIQAPRPDHTSGSGQLTSITFSGFSQIFLLPGGPAGVPEPATWAMMIAGFGLTGAALRLRRPVIGACRPDPHPYSSLAGTTRAQKSLNSIESKKAEAFTTLPPAIWKNQA